MHSLYCVSVNWKVKTVAEGQLSVGSFELRNCVATGNATQIWEVSEHGSPMQLAMKLLLKEAHEDSAEKAILRHEFKVGKLLDHPGFLRFHQIEVNRDHGFFIMDFVRSPSLKTHITTNLAAIQASFRKLAEGLTLAFQFMHDKGWLHRDIKSENILVNKAGEARIIDFSLASRMKSVLGKMLSRRGKSIQGTRTYIAPETILKKPSDQRTDMYSLGIAFYEVITGHAPFAGASPSDLLRKHLAEDPLPPSIINPNATPELDKVILKMLAKKPADRFESMQEVASVLHGLNCFKEDPVELAERRIREREEKESRSVDKRLDSRADAERTEKGISTPLRPQKKKPSAVLLREEQERQEREIARQASVQQPAVPGMAPMMPGMPYPGMPGYGVPQVPGMIPGMAPGQPVPGMPGYEVPQMPGMIPGMPPGQPIPVPPVPGQPLPGQQAGVEPVDMPQASGTAAGQPDPVTPKAPAHDQPPDAASTAATAAMFAETAPPDAAPAESPDTAISPPADEPQEATEEDVQDLMDLIE